MKTIMTKKKRQCEVLVVGAGIAGMSAAISAARIGADVLLVEKNKVCGGTATSGVNHYICGLYSNGKDMPRKTLNEGIAEEISSRLKSISQANTVTRMGKVYVLPFLTKDLMSVFSSLINKEKKLEVLNNFSVVSTKAVNDVITEVKVKSVETTLNVIPKVVIDCSGEGVIVKLSGARYRLAIKNKRQLAGYSIRIKGVSKDDEMTEVKVPYYIRKAISEKKLPPYLKFTTMSFIEGKDEGIIKLSIAPLDEEYDINRVKDEANKIQDYLVSEIPALKRSRIMKMSDNVLDREGLRGVGDYTLKTTDVTNSRKFTDGVVRNAWPIEFWDQKKGPRYQYLKTGEHYQIPLRCLKSRDITNLYLAGRCISVSQEALGSTRVMGACMSLGEEAGIAAAGCIS